MNGDKTTIGEMFAGTDSKTFLGFPACESLEQLDAEIAIIGAPCATPYRSVGPYCAGAPAAIRAGIAGYAAVRHHQDFDLGGPLLPDETVRVVDCGDLAYDATDFASNRDRIRETVRAVLDKGACPVVIGGDDSIPIPVMQAYEGRGPLTVLQVDAHIDWRDEVQGERYGLSSTMRRASELPWVEHMVQVGARAMGSARPGDNRDALDWGVSFITARDLHAEGVARVLEKIPRGSDVFVSFDVDGMDPMVMPAVIGPAPGGLSYIQVVEILHGVAAKAKIAGFALVEFLPDRDIQGLAALTAARVLCNAIGLIARGRGS